MLPEYFITFYYTFIHITPFDFFIFYLFRHRLRLSIWHTTIGYLLLIFAEGTIQIASGEIYNEIFAAFFQLFYLIYTLAAIRDYIPKILAISFLPLPLELISYNMTHYIDTHFQTGWSYLFSSLSVTLFYIVILLPAMKYIRRDLEPFVTLDDQTVWRYLFLYEAIAAFITLLIDPLNHRMELTVFISRFLLFFTNICCIYVTSYLYQNICKREYTNNTLNSLKRLQEMEQRRYNIIMDAWYSSRRLRHDLQHHIITINGFLQNQEYDSLKNYLRKTIVSFSKLS